MNLFLSVSIVFVRKLLAATFWQP